MLPASDPALALSLLTRRGFLRGTASGAALLLVGGGLSRVLAEELFEAADLGSREARVLRAVAETLFDPGSSGAPPPGDATTRRAVASVAGLGPDLAGQFRALLLAVEYGAYVLGFRMKAFSDLPPEERAAYLRGWEVSRVPARRMGFQALKLLLCAAYFADERAWAFMGYDGPWVGKFPLPVYPSQYERP